MMKLDLTPEQEAEAQRLAELVANKVKDDVLQMARLLASKKDNEILGKTEFDLRDRVHELGAHLLETALNERKKGGTKGPASPAPTAKKPPISKAIDRKTS